MKKEYIEDYSIRGIVENFIIGIVGFIFIYELIWKNYLLYNWRRGLDLPSKIPFLVIPGIIVLGGILFEYYQK